MQFRTLVAPILLVLALAVAACSPAGTASSAPSVVPSVEPSAPPSPSEEPSPSEDASEEPSAGGETVAVADSEFGQILVDGEGMTLYGFIPDQDADGEPTCYDACAVAWPPLLETDEVTVGAGLDDSSFDLAERTDGGMQVRIGDLPLYYWASDSAPGDTTGQGVGGNWFVVSPAGELIRE